jgi:hypothetical protein
MLKHSHSIHNGHIVIENNKIGPHLSSLGKTLLPITSFAKLNLKWTKHPREEEANRFTVVDTEDLLIHDAFGLILREKVKE